ncbi:ATP-binding protein [Burkholderia ambifaria]|uniref:ATP-binding protein n=1 Tax=Burkholderia ambifaria TaxID=152480 RepID=UPI00158EAC40|nr:ATP-binding protein [Burkholderia ambifaria]
MAQRFRIAARALRQLGAELITSDDVALNELIKNAFDAGSPRVSVKIHAPADISALQLLEEQIRAGSVLQKKDALDRVDKAISPDLPLSTRAALNDRARNHIDNKTKFSEFLQNLRAEQYIEISDTGKGMSKDDLLNRFLVIGTPGKLFEKQNPGSSQSVVLGEKGIGRLSMMRLGSTATIESTTSESSTQYGIRFEWNKFDDPNLYLDDVEVAVEPMGDVDESSHGTTVRIQNLSANWTADKVDSFIKKYIRRLQDPFVKNRLPYPIDIYLNGKRQDIASLPLWLEKCAQFKAEITFDPNGIDGTPAIMRRQLTWRGATSPEIRTWNISDLTRQLEIPADTFKRLGRFSAACLWFNRQHLTSNDVDRNRNEIAEELNQWCGGFSVYRDNFRVGKTGGMEDDWLEWDSGALKAKGFTLNRYQTIGSVSISSKINPHLIDAANRERLIACPEQHLLKTLLGEVIVQDFRVHINAIREAEVKIAIAEESTEESLRRSEDNLKKTLRTVEEISKSIPREQKPKLIEIRDTLKGQVEYVKTIKNALSIARETRVELLELANIGLVVEIVIHELSRLTESTGQLLTDLKQKSGDGAVQIIDNLRGQIVATNKRIRTVDAMSPSGRHRREVYDAVAQTRTIVSGFKNRFERHDIVPVVTLDDVEANESTILKVNMVRGLISQALENLLSNSVYWLQQGMRDGDEQRTIRVELDSKALTINVWDNGPGIDPRYGKEIFRPYYSTRKKGKGLGLYIASELVEYHGGSLYLDETPEADGRLRTFVIELPKEEK